MLVCDNCLHSFVCKYMDTMTPQDNCKCYRNRNGVIIIPGNPTNGDIIKTLFPETLIYVDTALKMVWFCIYEDKQDEDFDKHITFPLDWWNAPYKKGENK